MPSCLGLYIENNLIKYAKVSKNNDVIKVESFGVKFYENIGTTIKQIVEETYSFNKTPIAINTTDEIYNNIEVFSLLSKKDIDNVIKTEFENICYEKEVNKNIYEQRYILTKSETSNDKIKAIHISVPKTSIEQRKNQFSEYKISNIFPLSISIANLPKKEKKGTILIVNIEKNTTITKVHNGTISNISVIEEGSQEILDKINKKENSYSKAYEICKRATIYTEADKDLQYEENEYLEDIMPTLYQIASQVRKITTESMESIEKVYITGTAAVINNIDIYFQDYLKDINCEVLKPSFINNNSKINIKDYVEVNSAIAIGLQSLDKEQKEINFTKASNADKIFALLKTDVSSTSINTATNSVNEFLNKFSIQYNTVSYTFAFMAIAYILVSVVVSKQLDKNINAANISIDNTNARIAQVKEHNAKFNSRIQEYETMIANIENINDASSEDKRFRNTIPNLLNNIMAIIPKEVQLSSIENTSSTHIVIKAMSNKYEQIAFFKTKLKTEEILENVVSDTGTIQNGTLSVTIEGELP